MMNPNVPSRRTLLKSLGSGFGSLSLAGVLQQAGLLAAPMVGVSPSFGHTLAPRDGDFPAKARAIIQLFQNGGPSQMDLFDDKPELSKRNGQPHPEQVETFQLGNKNVLMGTAFKFARHGQSGMEFSELIPHLSSVADDLCLVRSMFSENNNHPGHIHGATDEFGYKSVENRVSVPDLHATILHQLGLDHTRLNFTHNGRPERLTDPEVTGARVVTEVLA